MKRRDYELVAATIRRMNLRHTPADPRVDEEFRESMLRGRVTAYFVQAFQGHRNFEMEKFLAACSKAGPPPFTDG